MLSIKSIEIIGLFGSLHHSIDFSKEEDIAILLGQNGIGKTAILKLLNMLFNHQLSNLVDIPFESAVLTFSEGQELHINMKSGYLNEVMDYDLYGDDFLNSTSCSNIANNVRDALKRCSSFISDNYRNLDDIWVDKKTGEFISSEELLWKCHEEGKDGQVDWSIIYPEWLYTIITSIHVEFIQTQRLYTQIVSIIPGRSVSRNNVEYQSTLKLIANEMKIRLTKIQQEYGQKSAELDESYPYRLVEKMEDLVFSKAELTTLKSSLDEIESRRERLRNAGLLIKTEWQTRSLSTNTRSAYVLKAISLHINDTKEKFALFDDELKRIELFRNLINERFFQKAIVIDPIEGICIESTDTGQDIAIDKLSSGEQHLIVLYYNMIFRFPMGTLVLIDEPEISLHVSWQKHFVTELKKIMKLNSMKAIIATHSPSLIGRYWGLTRELDKGFETSKSNGTEK